MGAQLCSWAGSDGGCPTEQAGWSLQHLVQGTAGGQTLLRAALMCFMLQGLDQQKET